MRASRIEKVHDEYKLTVIEFLCDRENSFSIETFEIFTIFNVLLL